MYLTIEHRFINNLNIHNNTNKIMKPLKYILLEVSLFYLLSEEQHSTNIFSFNKLFNFLL